MDTLTNSTGFYQDNLGPQAGGAFPCVKAYDYPTHFPNFHWWRPKENKKISAILRDEIPIPVLHNHYPYRYTSAAPCSVGRTQKEWDIYKCLYVSRPKVRTDDKADPKAIRQVRGFETSTVTESLTPFLSKVSKNVFAPLPLPSGLNEPSLIPYQGFTGFEKYIINVLYPDWKSNPLYRRRIQFDLRSKEDD